MEINFVFLNRCVVQYTDRRNSVFSMKRYLFEFLYFYPILLSIFLNPEYSCLPIFLYYQYSLILNIPVFLYFYIIHIPYSWIFLCSYTPIIHVPSFCSCVPIFWLSMFLNNVYSYVPILLLSIFLNL